MRVRLGEAMKLVAILAVGLGIGIVIDRDMEARGISSAADGTWLNDWVYFLQSRGTPFLAGWLVAGGILVWVELAMRRLHRPWGVGRWFASAGTLALLIVLLIDLGVRVMRERREGHIMSRAEVIDFAVEAFWTGLNWDRSSVFLACWLFARLAGWKGDPKPDAFEWACRLLLIATIIFPIGCMLFLNLSL